MRRVFCLVAAVMWFAAPGLFADVVGYTVTPVGGQFEYVFTLTNEGTTGGPLWDLFLSVPINIGDIDTGNIGTPVGWGDATGGLLFYGADVLPSTSFIDWAADGSGLYDLPVGSSMDGFTFTSSHAIDGPIQYSLNGQQQFQTANPEPATVWLSIASLGLLICAQRRYRVHR